MNFPRIHYHLFISPVAMETGGCYGIRQLPETRSHHRDTEGFFQSYDFLLTLVPRILQTVQWTFFEHLEAPHTLQLICGYNNYLNCTQRLLTRFQQLPGSHPSSLSPSSAEIAMTSAHNFLQRRQRGSCLHPRSINS